MDIPEYLHPNIAQLVQIETDTACRKNLLAVILGAKLSQDGNAWCCLCGENLQMGVAAFGKTPFEAMQKFEAAMYAEAQPAAPDGKGE